MPVASNLLPTNFKAFHSMQQKFCEHGYILLGNH